MDFRDHSSPDPDEPALEDLEWRVSELSTVGRLVGANILFTGFSIISIRAAERGAAKRLS